MRVVTRLPLEELWGETGIVAASRLRWITGDQVRDLLRVGGVQFVMADVGVAMRWVPLGECYEFWKREVLPHLADPESPVSLNEWPGGYFYFASEWSAVGGVPIVVCEKHH